MAEHRCYDCLLLKGEVVPPIDPVPPIALNSSGKRSLDILLEEFRRWDDERRKAEEKRTRVSSPLHHYTDMAGLVGIIGSAKLWFTGIFHMNDPSELHHGSDLAREHLFDIMQDEPSPQTSEFCAVLLKYLDGTFGSAFSFFVTSFSQTPDDLAQWQTYADDGRGVAIEVAPDWLKPDPSRVWEAGVSDPREFYSVAAVVYNEAEAKQRQKEAIDTAIYALKCAEKWDLLVDEADRKAFLKELRVCLGVPLLWSLITTKHHAYHHEAETRLILANSVSVLAPYVCSRARGSQIVSYVPVDFPIASAGVLRRIWIGPAAAEGAERGVADLLRAKGINPDRVVRRSTIPYRPR
ncbi:DUF2971 domain-containing protein [Reyranella sp.]|uniref:DUF2971 domain-containing protein n=1 Tax=Reyranella sp. TaxID=1929291 RepID=UPI003D095AC9